MTADELDYLASKEKSVTDATFCLVGAALVVILGVIFHITGWWGLAALAVAALIAGVRWANRRLNRWLDELCTGYFEEDR